MKLKHAKESFYFYKEMQEYLISVKNIPFINEFGEKNGRIYNQKLKQNNYQVILFLEDLKENVRDSIITWWFEKFYEEVEPNNID